MTALVAPIIDFAGQKWWRRFPDGRADLTNDVLTCVVGDDGLSWDQDRKDGRRCQRVELHTLPLLASTKVIDWSDVIAVSIKKFTPRWYGYIDVGQINSTRDTGDAGHPPWIAWNIIEPGTIDLMLNTQAEPGLINATKGNYRSVKRLPFALEKPHRRRTRVYRHADGLWRAQVWLDGVNVYSNVNEPMGFRDEKGPTIGIGIYTGEEELPIGSGAEIKAVYSGVRIDLK